MRSFFIIFAFFSVVLAYGQEVCTNGIDDDGDGKIDLNDPDCSCGTSAVTSIIPNPSFETYSSCPDHYSELNLATPWIQATDATSDYMNNCGYVFPAVIDAGLTHFPHGTGIAGVLFLRDYSEYLGATLSAPMVAGTNYQLTFNIAALMVHNDATASTANVSTLEPVNVTLYGCANGSNLPISTMTSPNLVDPTWIEIAHASYTPLTAWGEITMFFTPTININAVMLGAPNVLPSSYPFGSSATDLPYVLFDNLLLNTAASFGVNVTQSGLFCDDTLVLDAHLTTPVSPTATFQWYHDGVAIAGATTLTYPVDLNPANVGTYAIGVTNGSTCFVSTRVTVNNTVPSPSYVVVKPTCFVTTGSITITETAAGYSFDNGVTWQTSPTRAGLALGNYFIKIKTASGCISSSTGVTISEPQLLSQDQITLVQPSVCGGTGSITVNSPDAVSYSFDGGVTWTTNATATNLAPGTYYIKIKDAVGCASAAQYVYLYPINLNYPEYTVVQPDCTNGGKITVTSVAAEYSFDGGTTWSTNPVATNLPPGTYNVVVRNSPTCASAMSYIYLYFYNMPAPTYTAVKPYCGNGGTITITSVASEYSFDGGSTWTTNPVAINLPVGWYNLMARNGATCVSYVQYFYLGEEYIASPSYTMIQPTCEIVGSITITTPASEYSFDNGVTWGPNPTLSNITSGSYQLKVKNAGGCISGTYYVNVPPFYLPSPTYSITHPFCRETTGRITITATSGYTYSFDNGTTYQASNVSGALSPGNYYIKVKNAIGCESQLMYVYINYPSGIPSAPYGNNTQLYCIFNSPTISFLNATGTDIKWYSSATGTIPLSPQTPLSNGMTYYATQTINTCESQNRLAVTVTLSAFIIPSSDYQTLVCDDLNNGTETVDFTDYNGDMITNPVDYTFSYYSSLAGAENQTASENISNFANYPLLPGSHPFFVRLVAANGCYRVAILTLDLIPAPFVSMESSYILCQNTIIPLTAAPGFDGYLWSTGETTQVIHVDQPGNYSVTVTENHGLVSCTTTKEVVVKLSNPATITNIVTSDWTDYNNTITIMISSSSIGDYEYSLDGVHYQDSPIFYGLASGDYRAYVHDKNECGIVDKDVFLLMYPKYFTPNGDAYNDTWKIKFSEYEAGLTVKIFDRHGKFLKLLGNNTGWDGILNDRELPATDYWFLVTRANGKEYRGHFALKR